jgi:electron-transferring-flavoprotein dehydrogenase
MIADGIIAYGMIADPQPQEEPAVAMERSEMEVDIACAGFGPAMGGFLATLTRAWNDNPADPCFESKLYLECRCRCICYERSDNISAGVSGVVTPAKGIHASFPSSEPS